MDCSALTFTSDGPIYTTLTNSSNVNSSLHDSASVYTAVTKLALNNIQILRYLKNICKQPDLVNYKQLRISLIFRLMTVRSEILKLYKLRHKLKILPSITDVEISDEDGAEKQLVLQQFDTCSYAELTSCALSRLSDIREYRNFIFDSINQATYPVVVSYAKHLLERTELEVNRLLNMRRVLRHSSYNNWDSSLLDTETNFVPSYNFYDSFFKYFGGEK